MVQDKHNVIHCQNCYELQKIVKTLAEQENTQNFFLLQGTTQLESTGNSSGW